MKNFILNMLSTPGGSVSTKRVIGFLGFLFLACAMTANCFVNMKPSIELVDSVKYITIAALFGNALEKFAPNNTQPKID